MPYARCAELLADCLGLQVATALLLTWSEQAAGAVAAHTETVRAQLVDCEVVRFDETGTRVAGRTCWVHTACTRALTLYSVHTRRGLEAFEAMGVLPKFTGIAVHDGWKPYKTYAGAVHALCNAHHLRELAGVVDNADPDAPQPWASQLADLLVEIWDTIKDARAEYPWADGFSLDELERLTARTRPPARRLGDLLWVRGTRKPGHVAEVARQTNLGPILLVVRVVADTAVSSWTARVGRPDPGDRPGCSPVGHGPSWLRMRA
ncbi:transposase [Streptomyces sp. NPDC056672]|uniref:IS66 family transposase n=1 Tax=Streptomyces sp. NPDC056672 TaxID=3345906 RepID=UPI00367BAA5F